MRRRIAKLATFLLLGAIINVAVAWGCAYGCFRWFAVVETAPLRSIGFQQVEIRSLRLKYPQWVENELAILERDRLAVARTPPFHGREVPSLVAFKCDPEITVQQGGWPCYALSSTKYMGLHSFHVPLSLGSRMQESVIADCIRLPPDRDPFAIIRDMSIGPIRLPLRPIWPGFAINTIFYALLLWAFLAVPGYIKRRRRIKRGVCVRCAYPVGASSVCSECGTPRTSAVHGAAASGGPATPARDYR